MREAAPARIRRPVRMRRLIGMYASDGKAPKYLAGPLSIAGAAVWIGLAAGLLELGLTLALRPLYDNTPGFFRGNRHILWIIPTANLTNFTACGVVFAVAVRLWPRVASRLATFLLCFLASFTVLLAIRGLYLAACLILAAGLAARVEPWVRTHGRLVRGIIRWSFPALVIGVVALAGGSLGREILSERQAISSVPAAVPASPNVMLIVLDTVRADHMSPYGYGRDTTPNLARWSRAGVTFALAQSTAPWTLPSHASLFTGRWPHELSAGLDGPLDSRHPTLAELLRDSGYVTAGFVANTTYCSAETGLNRGFIHYEDHILTPASILRGSAFGSRVLDKLLTSTQRLAVAVGLGRWLGPGNGKAFKDAATLNRDLLSWLDARPNEQPFFAFLNYFDAHHPYVVPEGYDRHFGLRPETRADQRMLHRWWSMDKRRLVPRDVTLATDAYDDCLGYLDDQLGRLFAELEHRGVLSNTLVIVTADHGEHFGEHDLYGHASSLYSPEVHVPLMIVGPTGVPAGQVIDEPVSLRDVPATVADLLKLRSSGQFPGTSLARRWNSASGAEFGPVLSEVDAPPQGPANGGRSPVFRGSMRSLVAGKTAYIRNGDGREEVYNLAADPRELRDLAGEPQSTPVLERFRADMDRFPRQRTGPVSPGPKW